VFFLRPGHNAFSQNIPVFYSDCAIELRPAALKINSFTMLVFPAQLLALASALPVALACLGYEGGVPTATTTHTNSAPITVKSGQVFDCGWARYDRGSGACGSGEGGDADAVFLVQAGGTLRNCIIGKNQM
jgi:hypothetical protein